ncbi:MAG: cation transporter [Gemmatimonadaceae bacterium]|nr:cation transporter [Gemmatimonadaceae bacterium]
MTDTSRSALVRRGLLLNYATIGYNVVEAVVSVLAGFIAGSVALIAFGLDSLVEVTSSIAAQWRLRADFDSQRRVRVERAALRTIGASFLVLAAYVFVGSVMALYQKDTPEKSPMGVGILTLSVIVMPWLAKQRRQVAVQLGSRALEADARQTSLCAYLSMIALAGVGLTAVFGLWWADSIAALAMVPIIAIEGLEGVRGEDACGDDCN